MALWYVPALLTLLFCAVHAADYEEFIDPYDIDDTFHVQCNNISSMVMRIVFRGNAHKVFAPDNPGCEAVEVEPGHFEISDAMTITECTPSKASSLAVYSLELVIQKGNVRMFDDPIHLVTCNYELAGRGLSGKQKVSHSELARTPEFISAGNGTADSIVSLTVRDVHNKEITTAKVGSYIQLVAFMTPAPGEVSFRIWNCRAFSNDTGFAAEHHILVEGCGDDKVIKNNRGFKTYPMTINSGEIRVARSVFFRTFTLMSNPKIQFECDYIVRTDNSADGPSCKRSPAAQRKKRSADDVSIVRRSVQGSVDFDFDLPFAQTDEITITPSDLPAEVNVISYTVNEKLSEPELSSRKYVKAENAPEAPSTNNCPDNTDQISLLRQPLVVGLLSTCALLITVPVLIVLTLITMKKKWTGTRYHKAHYVQSPVYVASPSPKMDTINLVHQ